jgi:DNA-binding YbaB/EbfC family protein
MFGNLDTKEFEKALSSMQEQAKKFEDDSQNQLFIGKSGGGIVSASMNGKGDLIDLKIDSSLSGDLDSIQILVVGAVNDALIKVAEFKKKSAMNIVSGMRSFKFND